MKAILHRKATLLLCALAVGLVWTLATQGELIILRGGDVLKVTDFEVLGQSVRVGLPTGGSLSLPLLRVERIVDDEVLADWEVVPEPEPAFEVGYHPSNTVPPTPYGELIHAVARRHDLNPELVAAMVRCESSFDPRAESPQGARGLLQLMPATAERFGVSYLELHDPEVNLEAGARYISWLADRFDDDLPRVLAAFNSGEGTVDRFGGVPPYRETREYIERIFTELGIEALDTETMH